MKLEGHVWKDPQTRYWVIHVPSLDLSTQGSSRKNALAMIEDAIQTEVHQSEFKIQAKATADRKTILISTNQPGTLIAFLLRRQRQRLGLSIRDVARRLGSESPTAYAQYEQGKRSPSLHKLRELLCAIHPDLEPILKMSCG